MARPPENPDARIDAAISDAQDANMDNGEWVEENVRPSMSEDEYQELLDKLNANWDHLLHRYLRRARADFPTASNDKIYDLAENLTGATLNYQLCEQFGRYQKG